MSDLTPITREEVFYQSILNGQIPNLTPVTRQEMYLAAIAARIAAGGGGTGSGGGVASVGGIYPDLSGNVALKKLTFTGAVDGSYDGSKAMTINVENGKDGQDGADGLTPYIGENGNWWIGDTDTGVAAGGSGGSIGWVTIIDVTLEEAVSNVITDVDVNGNPFSVKDILWILNIPQDETASGAYFGTSNPNHHGSPIGVGYSLNQVKNSSRVFSGITTLVGTKQFHVSALIGTSEYNAGFLAPYGNIVNGAECNVTEFTKISAGSKNSAISLPIGTRIIVYGR